MTGMDLNEETFCLGENVASCTENPCFSPVLAAFAADEATLEPNRRSGVDRAEVVDLHLAGHGRQATRAD